MDNCVACGICKDACPVEAISERDIYIIESSLCLECGNCYEKCPYDAIENHQDSGGQIMIMKGHFKIIKLI